MSYVLKTTPQHTVSLEETFDGVSVEIDGYYICTFKHDGTVVLHCDVNPKETGLNTDADGFVIVRKENT